MAQYVEGYCDQQMPVPYTFKNVVIRSFPLKARYTELKAVVDKYLNIAPPAKLGFEFRPVKPLIGNSILIYMMVLDYESMRCTEPPYSDWGFLSQRELCFGIPVVRWKGFIAVDLALFTPYIFVDNPWSLVCGNTVVGYPKQMARFELPPDAGSGYPIRIDAPVFVTHSPSTPLTWQRLVNVEGPPTPLLHDEESLWPFGDVQALFGPNGLIPVDGETFDLFTDDLATKSHSVVQFKQIRDAVKASSASYQAILSFTSRLDSQQLGVPLPPAVIEVNTYASLAVSAALGLESTGGKIISQFPYSVQCDFSFIDPKVLYP